MNLRFSFQFLVTAFCFCFVCFVFQDLFFLFCLFSFLLKNTTFHFCFASCFLLVVVVFIFVASVLCYFSNFGYLSKTSLKKNENSENPKNENAEKRTF